MKPTFLAALVCVAFMVPIAAAQDLPDAYQIFRQLLENETREVTPEDTKDQDIRELIEALMMVRLSKALALNDEETVLFIRKHSVYRSQFLQQKRKRAEIRRELREALHAKADDATVKAKLDELMRLEVAIAQSTCTMIEESRKDLTLSETAKFYLFIGDFDHELRQLVMRARERSSQNHEQSHRPPSAAKPRASRARPKSPPPPSPNDGTQ